MDCNLKRYCKWCGKELESTDRRHQVCNAECRKLYVKDYQKNIPIELKRMYEKRYLSTANGKKYKSEKNRRYREKVLLLSDYMMLNKEKCMSLYKTIGKELAIKEYKKLIVKNNAKINKYKNKILNKLGSDLDINIRNDYIKDFEHRIDNLIEAIDFTQNILEDYTIL